MAILPTKHTRTRCCTQNRYTKLYLKLTKRLFAITALTHTNEHVFEIRVKLTINDLLQSTNSFQIRPCLNGLF